jgi:hypothetical protein
MAVTATHLTTAQNGSAATSYTTASISPTANRLVLVAVGHQVSSGTVNTPTISGAGMTWTQVATKISSKGTLRRLTVFRALSASPGSGALTIDLGGQSQIRCGWSIAEFDGIDTGGTNGADAIVQSASNDVTDNASTTSLTVTLSAFSHVDNATYGAIRFGGSSNTDALTFGSGFTQLGIINGSASYQSQFKASNDTTVDWTYNNTAWYNQGIAIELKAAVVATSGIKKFLSVAQASLKKVSSVAEASVKKIAGVSN